MELIVKPYTMPKAIEFNFEELKTALEEKVKEYEIAIYSDDQIKQAKADRATLNALKKALNDERIRREKEYMVPFTEFKSRVNEIIGIIDRPINAIDTQVKAFEEKRKEEKAEEIRTYMAQFSLPYNIPAEMLFSQKWLNATVSMASVKKEIDEKVSMIQEDLETLESLEEYQAEAIEWYSNTLDLRGALNEIKRKKEYEERLKKIEEEQAKKTQTEAPKKPEPEAKPAQPEKIPEEPEVGQWVNFSAYLTPKTAKALKDFFTVNNIEFKPL